MPPLLQILFYILLIQRVLLKSIRYFRIKYFCQSVCDTTPIARGDRMLSISGEFVEVLNFRHFARYMSFARTGNQGRKKQIMDGIEVSVVLHVV